MNMWYNQVYCILLAHSKLYLRVIVSHLVAAQNGNATCRPT